MREGERERGREGGREEGRHTVPFKIPSYSDTIKGSTMTYSPCT